MFLLFKGVMRRLFQMVMTGEDELDKVTHMSKHRAGDPLGMPEIVLTRDIAAGEFFTYTAPRATDRVRIIGNIGAGADVTVTAAEFELVGNVGANSRVTFELPKAKGMASTFNALAGPRDGLIIDGSVADNVVMASDSGIRVRGKIGATVLALAAGDIRASWIGDQAQLQAGRDLAITGVGAQAKLQAGARATLTYLGQGSAIKARAISGARATTLPYRCPHNSRDMLVGARTTHIYNGKGIARLKSY